MRPRNRVGRRIQSARKILAVERLRCLTAAKSIQAWITGRTVCVSVPRRAYAIAVYRGTAIAPAVRSSRFGLRVRFAVGASCPVTIVGIRCHGVAPKQGRTTLGPASGVAFSVRILDVVVIVLVSSATANRASIRLRSVSLNSGACAVEGVVAHDEASGYSAVIRISTVELIVLHEQKRACPPTRWVHESAVSVAD